MPRHQLLEHLKQEHAQVVGLNLRQGAEHGDGGPQGLRVDMGVAVGYRAIQSPEIVCREGMLEEAGWAGPGLRSAYDWAESAPLTCLPGATHITRACGTMVIQRTVKTHVSGACRVHSGSTCTWQWKVLLSIHTHEHQPPAVRESSFKQHCVSDDPLGFVLITPINDEPP